MVLRPGPVVEASASLGATAGRVEGLGFRGSRFGAFNVWISEALRPHTSKLIAVDSVCGP